jgi:hypothetical protein
VTTSFHPRWFTFGYNTGFVSHLVEKGYSFHRARQSKPRLFAQGKVPRSVAYQKRIDVFIDRDPNGASRGLALRV